MKCYPVKWEFFEMNHDKRIFRPFFVPQVELTTSISPFHHFTIKCWNHPTFYFHFNPQNKAVWWTLPHLTFPSEISGGPMRLMPRRRKSNPCMAKSPRCVGAKHLMMSCQVGRLVPVCRGDDFFLGRNLSNPPKTRSLIWLVKGMVKAPYQLYIGYQTTIYIYIIYSIYSIYSESSKNTGKTCGKDGTLGKSESNPSFSQMLDILTSWCPLQCLQQWWSSPGKLKFSKGADRQMIRVVLYKHYHLRFKQHQQKHAGMYQFRWRYPAATSTVHVPAGRWTISQKSPQFDSSELCPSLVPNNFLFTSLWSLRTTKKKLTQPMCFIKNDTPGCAFLSFCNDFNDGPGSHIQDFLLSKPRAENEARSWVIDQDTNSSKQGSIILMSGIF